MGDDATTLDRGAPLARPSEKRWLGNLRVNILKSRSGDRGTPGSVARTAAERPPGLWLEGPVEAVPPEPVGRAEASE